MFNLILRKDSGAQKVFIYFYLPVDLCFQISILFKGFKMKKLALFAAVFIMDVEAAMAKNLTSPIANIMVTETTNSQHSIQNLSPYTTSFEINGELITLKPSTGVSLDCKFFSELELIVKNVEHDYFVVPCQSKVVLQPTFKIKYKG